MKRTVLLTGMLVAVLLGMNGYAQEEGNHSHDMMNRGAGRGMMGQGMMNRGMMGQRMAGMGMMGMEAVDGFGSAGLFLQHSEHLSLTEPQATQLREIQRDQLQDVSGPRTSLQAAQLELDDLLETAAPNMGDIEDKIREIEAFRSDILVAIMESAFRARNVLTAEQRELADELTGRRGMGRRMTQPGMGGAGGGSGMGRMNNR